MPFLSTDDFSPEGRRDANRIRGYSVPAFAQLDERRGIKQTNNDREAVFLVRGTETGTRFVLTSTLRFPPQGKLIASQFPFP